MRYLIIFFLFIGSVHSQKTIDDVLKKYNKQTIPYLTVDEVQLVDNYIILDAREWAEYQVSHLKNAVYVGYKTFDTNKVKAQIKNSKQPILVYCSLGVRSEQIAEKIKALGYSNVYNLYGGIFEWKNKNFQVVDESGKITENVHAFSKEWSKYLLKGKKIY